MPAEYVLHLQHDPDSPKPLHDSRALSTFAHAAFIDAVPPEVGQALHQSSPSNFTLIEPHDLGGGAYRLRLRLLEDDHVIATDRAIQAAENLRLSKALFTITDYEMLGVDWYEFWDRANPAGRWTVNFWTPTVRRNSNKQPLESYVEEILPDPFLTWASVLHRWEQWGPPGSSPVAAETLISFGLGVAAAKIKTAAYPIKPGVELTGIVGQVDYAVRRNAPWSDEELIAFDALTRFASFAGIGDQTAKGMGRITVGSRKSFRRAKPEW